MEPDKLKKCEWLINEMMKHLSVEVKGVSLCIQLEQAKQTKRIADALEYINNKDSRVAMRRRHCGPM